MATPFRRPACLLSVLALAVAVSGCEEQAAPASGGQASEGGEEAKAGDDGAQDAHAAHAAVPDSAATKGPKDAKARVFFAFPQDASKVLSPVSLAFGVEGMTVTPAGQAMSDQTKGHHHLIVDGQPVPAGTAVPADDTHIHYGGGQTEAKVELKPGKHTLTLQFADGAHLSYGPAMAETITVEVQEPKEAPKVFFESPKDGAKVKSPVKLKFGIAGMTVRPAGEDPLDKTSGHHHVIVDGKPGALGTIVPADATHIHYGKGQTEAELPLSPGKHTLTLQLADGVHASYGPELSHTITVEVQP